MMSDWWTYELSDLILFSSNTYYRLIELYNADLWPLHILTFLTGCVVVVLVWRRPAWHGKVISLIFTISWLWVAWAFHWQRFANIHWVASYFALAFGLQAILLFWTGVIKDNLLITLNKAKAIFVGSGIIGFALFIQPFTMMLLGHSWKQAELFGITPDPTVTATIGILLLSTTRKNWWLMIIPVLWCFISAATLWVLESVNAAVMLATGLLVLVFVTTTRNRDHSD